jgi:hypothetical protein
MKPQASFLLGCGIGWTEICRRPNRNAMLGGRQATSLNITQSSVSLIRKKAMPRNRFNSRELRPLSAWYGINSRTTAWHDRGELLNARLRYVAPLRLLRRTVGAANERVG